MALVLDVTGDREAVWREYEPGVDVKIRPLYKADLRRYRKKATPKKRGFRQQREINDEQYDSLIFRDAVEDWEGVVDPKLNPIPASDEMIDLVCGKYINFSAWILEEALSLGEMSEEDLNKEKKTLRSSHAGSETGQED